MTRYAIAEAKNNFSKLIEQVERGEVVEITKRGQVVAQITPKVPVGQKLDLAWIRANRVQVDTPGDIVATLNAMRDEYPY